MYDAGLDHQNLNGDLYQDVRTFEPTEDLDVVCCSPDCREISRARSKKGAKPTRTRLARLACVCAYAQLRGEALASSRIPRGRSRGGPSCSSMKG